MKNEKLKKSGGRRDRAKFLLISLSLLVVHFSLFTAVSAQRDYFTPEEVEMIRDAQQIDQRVDLLVRVVDRRFTGIGVDPGGTKLKDADKWGAQPTARGELLLDIKHILQKAIDDVDNVASHPDSLVFDPADPEKKPKSFGSIFPKAVHKLADAATRWKPALQAQLAQTKDEKERGSLLDSIEMCDDIIASVAKLSSMPKPSKK